MTFQFAFGPRIRKSPFFEATVKAGATAFAPSNHGCFPVSYGDPIAEYRRLTEGVAIWDVAVEQQVRIMGKDALELVKILTCLLYTSPSPRDLSTSRMPSSA